MIDSRGRGRAEEQQDKARGYNTVKVAGKGFVGSGGSSGRLCPCLASPKIFSAFCTGESKGMSKTRVIACISMLGI